MFILLISNITKKGWGNLSNNNQSFFLKNKFKIYDFFK